MVCFEVNINIKKKELLVYKNNKLVKRGAIVLT